MDLDEEHVLTETSTTAGRTPDDLVEIIAAERERTTTTAYALVDAVTVGFFVLKFVRMFGVPVLLERICGWDAVTVQAIASWRKSISTPDTAMAATLLASMGWTERRRRGGLNVTEKRIDGDAKPQLRGTLLVGMTK